MTDPCHPYNCRAEESETPTIGTHSRTPDGWARIRLIAFEGASYPKHQPYGIR